MKLLIIDDDPDILRFHISSLSKKNFEVETAHNGKEALQKAKRISPDIVISDIFMSDINGFALCKLWCEDEQLKNIPFLFYSSISVDNEDKEFAYKLGAKGLLQKPLRADELLKAVEEINGKSDADNSEEDISVEEINAFYKRFTQKLLNKIDREITELKYTQENSTDEKTIKERILNDSRKFEEKLKKIVDLWPYVMVFHRQGKVVYANEYAAKVLGLKNKNELIGRDITRFVHPDTFLIIQERLLRLQRGEQVDTIVEKFLTVDGETVELKVSAFVFDNNEPFTYLVMADDVTEENRRRRISEGLNNAGRNLLKALTRDEVFEVVASELIKFGISTILLRVDDEKEFLLSGYKYFNSKKLKLLETLVGDKNLTFKFPIDLIDPDREIRDKRKTSYRPDFLKQLRESLKEPFRSLAEKVQNMLNLKASLICPLFVNEEFIGILAFQSPDIRENDVDIFAAFSHEFALAWRNVDLMEKMQKEIQERKNAEDALFESELRFKTLADISQVLIYVFAGDRPVYANKSVSQLTGYSEEELLKMDFWELIHPDYREKVKQTGLARQRGEDVPERYTFPLLTKDGRTVWLDYSASVTEIGDKTIVVGTAVDITKQKEATEKLKESEERFRTLTETTSTAIFVYSGNKFVYCNKATEELTGYTQDELIGMDFWQVVHPEFKELIRQRGLARQRGEKIPNRYEFKIVRKDGETRWIDFTAGKINWGGETASIGTAIDITERKKAELEKEEKNK